MHKLTLTCLISLALLQACDNAPESTDLLSVSNNSFTVAELQGSSWELMELTVLGGFSFVPDESGKYTLQFRTDNRLTGQSDCNTITGQWTYAETFAITDFSTSRSLCISGSLHNYYSLYLRDVNDLAREGDQLVLKTPTEEVRLVFSARGN